MNKKEAAVSGAFLAMVAGVVFGCLAYTHQNPAIVPLEYFLIEGALVFAPLGALVGLGIKLALWMLYWNPPKRS